MCNNLIARIGEQGHDQDIPGLKVSLILLFNRLDEGNDANARQRLFGEDRRVLLAERQVNYANNESIVVYRCAVTCLHRDCGRPFRIEVQGTDTPRVGLSHTEGIRTQRRHNVKFLINFIKFHEDPAGLAEPLLAYLYEPNPATAARLEDFVSRNQDRNHQAYQLLLDVDPTTRDPAPAQLRAQALRDPDAIAQAAQAAPGAHRFECPHCGALHGFKKNGVTVTQVIVDPELEQQLQQKHGRMEAKTALQQQLDLPENQLLKAINTELTNLIRAEVGRLDGRLDGVIASIGELQGTVGNLQGTVNETNDRLARLERLIEERLPAPNRPPQ